jgi:hypothetical protein
MILFTINKKTLQASLATLGVPFMDVLRVLSAVLLLGNVQVNEKNKETALFDQTTKISSLDYKGNNEVKAVASLLGISSVDLYRGLTTKSQTVRGQLIKSVNDGATVSFLSYSKFCCLLKNF